jgi:putative tributyrin esterase
MFKSKIFNLCVLILAFTFAITAQVDKQKESTDKTAPISSYNTPVKVEDFKLASKLMNREMPYKVIFPPTYGIADTKRFPVVYLLHGLFGHFDNWAEKTKLTDYAKDYEYIIVMPEGNNGWYVDSVSVPNDKYETYIVDELINEVDKKFRTIADKQHRAIGGLSMGGYGALKFGIKYPDKFILAGSFSGAVAIASFKTKENLSQGMLRNSVIATFGDADTDTKKSNDIFKLIAEMPQDKALDLPFLYIDCGTEDELGLLTANKEFVDLLMKRNVLHEFRQLPGRHNWKFWDSQVNEFLRVSKKFIGVGKQ